MRTYAKVLLRECRGCLNAPQWLPTYYYHRLSEASDGDNGFSMNYLSISKNLREGESAKHSLKLEADGCTWNLNSCVSLLPVRLVIGLLASEAQCSHLPKEITDTRLQGDFEDKIVCVLESCSHLPKPPGDVLCILCPPCSDIFPCPRLSPKAPPLCQVPFPRIYLCSENPCHTVAVHTSTTCSLPRNTNQGQPGIFQGNLGDPTSFPQEGRLPSGLLVWGPPGFFFLGTDLHRVLIKDSAWCCH